MSKLRAVAYLRVSSKGQIDGHGFDRQGRAVREYARRHNIEIVEVYRESQSGVKDAADRPAFQEMLADMLSNGARLVLVESLDRLAREYRVQEQFLVYLVSKGIALIAVNTSEDVTAAIAGDPMKKAMVQMQGIFAELEKAQLVRKLAKARIQKRQETGRCEGRKPYGDRLGEQEVIERIRQLRRKPPGGRRMSYARIAAKLNKAGQPSRAGAPWGPSSVQAISKRLGLPK